MLKFLLGAATAFIIVASFISPKTMSIYTTGDIVHIEGRKVTFESSEEVLRFSSDEELFDWVGKYTAKYSTPIGYGENLQWYIDQSYISVKVVENPDEEYAELLYHGPHWAVNPEQDTAFVLGYFNYIEKLFDPKREEWLIEAYNLD